ncbi:uncharacterized protein [Coffea arabica]|uniref:Uncharacterized protein n=1 Tax=Coffea arabica TaxID=13443 RepID=A0ABM4W0Z5_COFAR
MEEKSTGRRKKDLSFQGRSNLYLWSRNKQMVKIAFKYKLVEKRMRGIGSIQHFADLLNLLREFSSLSLEYASAVLSSMCSNESKPEEWKNSYRFPCTIMIEVPCIPRIKIGIISMSVLHGSTVIIY